MKVIVIDGQGGRMGRAVVEQLKSVCPELPILAIGTNSTATAAMLKAGADAAATGENPVIVASRDADLIIGPIGIVIADSMLGEITPAMASAVGSSGAHKILIPVSNYRFCKHTLVGCGDQPMGNYIKMVGEEVLKFIHKDYVHNKKQQ